MGKQGVQRQIAADPTLLNRKLAEFIRQSLASTKRCKSAKPIRRGDINRFTAGPQNDWADSEIFTDSILEQDNLALNAGGQGRVVPMRVGRSMRHAAHSQLPVPGIGERDKPRAHGVLLRARHGAASSHSLSSGKTPCPGRMRSVI